jgi:hypothetical protein
MVIKLQSLQKIDQSIKKSKINMNMNIRAYIARRDITSILEKIQRPERNNGKHLDLAKLGGRSPKHMVCSSYVRSSDSFKRAETIPIISDELQSPPAGRSIKEGRSALNNRITVRVNECLYASFQRPFGDALRMYRTEVISACILILWRYTKIRRHSKYLTST